MRDFTPRFIVAALLIAATAVYLYARGNEIIPDRSNFSMFPAHLGDRTGTDVPIPEDVLDVLRPSDYLLRVYQNPQAQDVVLFIPYFRSQRAGDAIHSPQNCLPGAGWVPIENKRITLTLPGHVPFPANRYLIAKEDTRELVVYWYWAHDRGVASEYWAKYYLVRDSIKMNRSDGALVRISTPMNPGETVDAAQQRLLPFASAVLPLLNDYVPR